MKCKEQNHKAKRFVTFQKETHTLNMPATRGELVTFFAQVVKNPCVRDKEADRVYEFRIRFVSAFFFRGSTVRTPVNNFE